MKWKERELIEIEIEVEIENMDGEHEEDMMSYIVKKTEMEIEKAINRMQASNRISDKVLLGCVPERR